MIPSNTHKISVFSLTLTALEELLSSSGLVKPKQTKMRSFQIYRWLYQEWADSWSTMTDLPQNLREWLEERVTMGQLALHHRGLAEDGTTKFLWRLPDGKTIESVLIPRTEETEEGTRIKRLTLCISSQVGCAMACKFCLTGIQGLDRHLGAGEIVEQVWRVRKEFSVTNIVFMGMGEPLHNLENVLDACTILLEQRGLNFSKRRVTVSTSGLVPAIKTLGERVGVNLAVSLNATTDAIRDEIMPVNKRYPIGDLVRAAAAYPGGKFRRMMFEYVLLRGVNDTEADAERLVTLSRRANAKINLIPFNEHPGASWKRPTDAEVLAFQKFLLSRKVTATIRHSRGRDILAACGQLRSMFGTARGTDRHKDAPRAG